MHRLFLSLLLIVSCGASHALSFVFPKFGVPIRRGEILVLTSWETNRVFAVDLAGRKIWDRSFSGNVRLLEASDHAVWLQVGKSVRKLDPASGDTTPLFELEDAQDVLIYEEDVDLLYSQNRFSSEHRFKVLDRKTGAVQWRHANVEGLLGATQELLILVAARRHPAGKGAYLIREPTVFAVNRSNHQPIWARKISDTPRAAALVPPFLVLPTAENELRTLSLGNGAIVGKQRANSRIITVAAQGTNVIYLTSTSDLLNLSQTEQTLHFCSLPDLQETSRLQLKILSASALTFWEDLIITDALYRTAAFRSTGEKLWEKSQMNRTEVIDGFIYFSSNNNGVAQLGVIEARTGKEKILYSENLPPELQRTPFNSFYSRRF